jgi:hypothetical protein
MTRTQSTRSISRVIDARGMKSPEHVFRAIKSYQDLVDVNVAFLQGKIAWTPYHAVPVDKETVPLLGDLVRINKAGFISLVGQPAEKETGQVDKSLQVGDQWFQLEQKSFVGGYMPKSHLLNFIYFMKNKPDYYYVVYTSSSEPLISTLPSGNLYNVTRDKGSSTKQRLSSTPWRAYTNVGSTGFDYDTFVEYPNICRLLKDTVYVTIAGKEYGRGSVEKLLLEFYHPARVSTPRSRTV